MLHAALDTQGATPLALDPEAKTVILRDADLALSTLDVATGAKTPLGERGTAASFDQVGSITLYQPGADPCGAGEVLRGPVGGPFTQIAPLQGTFFSRRLATSPSGRFVAWSRELTAACDPGASRVYAYDEQAGSVDPILSSDDGQHEAVVGALADGSGYLLQRSSAGAAPYTIVRVLWSDSSSTTVYPSLPEAVASGVGCDTAAMLRPSGQLLCMGTGGLWQLDARGTAPKALVASLVGGRAVASVVDVVTLDAPGPEETCNFEDDDGDGSVDEGFDWAISPWTTLHTFALIGATTRAIRLSDGSVAVSGMDSYGEGTDKGWLMRVDTDGALLAGPTLVPIPLAGGDGGRLFERDGDLVAAWNSTDYKGCEAGCPVVIRSFDKSTLAVKSSGTTFAAEAMAACGAAALGPAGTLLLGCHKYVGSDYQPRIVRLDSALTSIERMAVPGVAVAVQLLWGAGELVQYAGAPAIGMSFHGAFELGGPDVGGVEKVAPEPLGSVSPALVVAHSDGTLLFTERAGTASIDTLLYGASGERLVDAVPLRTTGYPDAAVAVGNNTLYWSHTANKPTAGELRRFRRDGREVPTPGGAMTGIGGYGKSGVRVPGGVLLFRGRAYLDHPVEVAKLTCKP